MHPGKNLHGRVARIVAHKLFINFENAFQFAIQNLAVDVGQVKVDHRLAINAEMVLVHDLEDGASSYVARHQIPVLWIPLFEEIPALSCRDAFGIALVTRLFRDPDASALATR